MRTGLKRIASVSALSLGLVAAVQGATFGPASAASWQCIIKTATNRAEMQGSLCVRRGTSGYYAQYTNRGGYPEFVNFNLTTPQGTYGDLGPFWANTGETRNYYFAVGDKGCRVYLTLYDRAGSDPSWRTGNAC